MFLVFTIVASLYITEVELTIATFARSKCEFRDIQKSIEKLSEKEKEFNCSFCPSS